MKTIHKEWIAFEFKKDLQFPMFTFKAGEKWMGTKTNYPIDTDESAPFGKGTLYFKDIKILYSGKDKIQAIKSAGW